MGQGRPEGAINIVVSTVYFRLFVNGYRVLQVVSLLYISGRLSMATGFCKLCLYHVFQAACQWLQGFASCVSTVYFRPLVNGYRVLQVACQL